MKPLLVFTILGLGMAYLPSVFADAIQVGPPVIIEAKLREVMKSQLHLDLKILDYLGKVLHLKLKTPSWTGYIELDRFCDLLPNPNHDNYVIAHCDQPEVREQGQWFPKVSPTEFNGLIVEVDRANSFDETSLKRTLGKVMPGGDSIDFIGVQNSTTPIVIFSEAQRRDQPQGVVCQLGANARDLRFLNCLSQSGSSNEFSGVTLKGSSAGLK